MGSSHIFSVDMFEFLGGFICADSPFTSCGKV